MNDFIGEAMNDLETGYNSTTCRDTQPLQEEDTPAPATVYGRQESDESYEGVISREGDLRIVNCPDDIQWIAQRRTGGRWRNKSFHRTRRSLIQRYGALEMILALPEHHDGFIEVPRCGVCGRIATKPTGVLPRHMFCLAFRRRQRETAPRVTGPLPNRRLRSRRLVRRAPSSFDLKPYGDIDAHN